MIQLSPYGQRVVLRINLIGMWIAVLVSVRNFTICYSQYRKTKGKIHLINMAQVTVLFVHRLLYGIIPLFEIHTCAYFPLLVSLWHITYILFYTVMFMRLVILELDRYSRLIKCIGLLLIGLRFADWPYELAFISIQERIMAQNPGDNATCWAIWGSGVIILNFIGDALANLFLSGMFVRRLFIHINSSKTIASQHNRLISSIARKSLICLTLTFFVNLVMNLFKVTMFLGNQSDAFTVYFELIESTLLVEALRNDSSMRAGPNTSICESCHKELSRNGGHKRPNNSEEHHSQMLVRSFSNHQNKKHSFISETDENTAYDENVIENITPVQPAMFHSKQHRHTHYQHQQKQSGDLSEQETHSFSTSLAPRPITSSSKDLFMSLNAPSAPLPPPPFSGESFAMVNVEKDRHASHTSPTASRSESVANSNHSQPTSY